MATSRSFVPVWEKQGACPNPEWHFRGAAREVYSYLKLLADKHGGFVFASVDDITRHTKRWSRLKEPFTKRHCERILRMFRELGVLSKRQTVKIHGRNRPGWQLVPHSFWTVNQGGLCEFVKWEAFEAERQHCMGHAKAQSLQENVGDCVGQCVGDCVG